MTPISGLVICRNEEKVIARCLSSLKWVDELVVVDGGSTDRTLSIIGDSQAPWASKLKLLQRPWTGFRDQRNFLLSHASHNWVLSLDADEACSSELEGRIRSLLSEPNGPPHPAYKIRRKEYFLGKEMTHGIWNPSYQDRFFNRTGVEYVNEIHEYPRFSVVPREIHEAILHWPDFDPDKFLDKMNRYTTLDAERLYREGRRTNAFQLLFAFPAMVYKNFIYYGAYRDGYHGFVASLLEGISRVVRHIKLWQYQHREK